MRLITFITLFLFLSCCQSRKEQKIDKQVLNAEQIIINTENILSKIPSSKKYSNLKPVFSTNGKSIYLSYGNFERDSNYRIDTLKSIPFLNKDEFELLKNSIYQLSKIGISDQDYIIFNPDLNKGIYIYSYKNSEPWKLDTPEKATYVSLGNKIDKNDLWFGNTFKIISSKNHLVLLTKIRG
ncbi:MULTISPECIES: hypothetical protein [Chryseobacterium]|uniref:hypothetical protein n=1 Tax=Chryseobacterium TaxID=59732 RepID=UPI000C9E5B2B|nr:MULTISPECIES: hypothetical protein [Chryseobacterium]VXB09423.1 hypothetical protein CHRYSEO8AT_130004 [Chryseobacterium sp. 8AT]